MVQMLSRQLKPLGRPKQPRPTAKLNNTTVRDFGGGLNVVDSEQNLTSKFAPVFDNMVTYTDRRVGPRYGFEMWLKLKQGLVSSGTASITMGTTLQSRIVIVNWTAHPFGIDPMEHVTFVGIGGSINGITAAMLNKTHGIRHVINANAFEIVVEGAATATGTSGVFNANWTRDTHAIGGEPVEARYFANYLIVWSTAGEILTIDRNKLVTRIWSADVAYALAGNPIPWSYTDFVAHDIFGKELICCNGKDKPLSIDFTRVAGQWVLYLVDPGNSFSNDKVPTFDACKSAFRFFTIHDSQLNTYPEHLTEIRIAAKDTSMVYSDSPNPSDAIDIDMSKIAASPEQTVRGFATIKDALLVISPNSTTMMKLGIYTTAGVHDAQPVDTMNGFGSNAPRSIVSIGSDVFMLDFNGVPSAKLSSISNAVVPERVSNYIETMISKHIGRMRKDTMRLKAFSFYDGKNKTVHFYIPNFDLQDIRRLTDNPFFFDADLAEQEFTKRTLIMRHDAHLLEQDDIILISGATGFSTINASAINGERRIVGILNENYLLVEIGEDLPPATTFNTSGGGNIVDIKPVRNATIGYIYHYVPQLKLFAWSRFKTPQGMMFNCGCGTLEGRAYTFTPEGYVMRYGSPDGPVYADWKGMYDFITWTSGQTYHTNERVFDSHDGLVYKCLSDVTRTATNFQDARTADPDNWEEYKGEPINFTWELPWSDFGQRQHTKALRFVHADASGLAPFKLELFADNIYKDAATGELQPSRSLTFVANDAGAYGAGPQVYGAGRRTREQKLWQVPVKCKLLKVRVTGSTTESLSISALSFLYHKGSVVRG